MKPNNTVKPTVKTVPSKHFPLHLFLERLSSAGLHVGVRDYRRISTVLAAEGVVWTLERLERVLGSLLTHDADERLLFQHQFRVFFNVNLKQEREAIDVSQWRIEIEQLLAEKISQSALKEPHSSPPILYVTEVANQDPKQEQRQQEQENSRGTLRQILQRVFQTSRSTLKSSTLKSWISGRKCAWKVKILATFFVFCALGLATYIILIDGTKPPQKEKAPVTSPRTQTDKLSGKPPISDYVTVRVTKPPEPSPPELWLLAMIISAVLTIGLLGWWWLRFCPPIIRRRYRVFCDATLPEHYFKDAEVGDAPDPWLSEAESDHLADLLRFVLTDRQSDILDIDASIRATSESGNVPVLRFKKHRDLQKVLILTDQRASSQSQHHLPDELAHALERRGVRLTFGRFNHSPERFIDQHGRVQHLMDWEEHRHYLLLLIFADTQVTEGLQDFPWRDWPDARLLTRQERRNWGFCEQSLLAQGARLLAADPVGVLQAWDEAPRRPAKLAQRRLEMNEQKPDEKTIEFLQRVLGAALPWAQALAYYPGAWSFGAAEQLRALLCPELSRLALQRLLHLPNVWVGEGVAEFKLSIQEALRQGFLQGSRQEQEVVVEAWLRMMEAVKPPEKTLAWAIWRWKCLRLGWVLHPDESAEALHALVKSQPELKDAIGNEIQDSSGTGGLGGLFTTPGTRKGKQHLLEIADACGLKKIAFYAPASKWLNSGLVGLVLVMVLGGVGIWNEWVGPPPEIVELGAEIDVPVPHMLEIAGGVFKMGCVENHDCEDNEKPVREVTIPAFELAAYEVTVAQFRAFVEASGYQTTAERKGQCTSYDSKGEKIIEGRGYSWRNPGYPQSDNTPVTCISWDDSKAYLSWLSEQTQGEWRLPTEAEWEYAARAGSAAAYSWGDQSPVCDRVAENGAQFGNCEEKAPVTVGSYTANAFGLYDVHGNAWEWVEDCYVNNYDGAQTNGSARNDCGNPVLRVLRGGSWSYEPWYLRAAYRGDDDPAGRTNDVGFRAARTIHPLPFTDVTPTPQLPEKDAVATELVQTIPEIPVPKMVQIPAGTFLMGCDPKRDDVEGGCFDNEKPAHEVRLKSFWLSETEVTVEQYLACVQAGGCSPPEWQETKKSRYEQLGEALTGKNYPIVGVSWRDANDYTQWLSQQTGKQYRLPTEAEWEYAARAGTNTAYFWGNSIGENNANCAENTCGDSFEYIAPVSSFTKNPFGLSDMLGNVWEWVEDCYVSDYEGAPVDGAEARIDCGDASRGLRGGSWANFPRYLRATDRYFYGAPGYRSDVVGFRAARTN